MPIYHLLKLPVQLSTWQSPQIPNNNGNLNSCNLHYVQCHYNPSRDNHRRECRLQWHWERHHILNLLRGIRNSFLVLLHRLPLHRISHLNIQGYCITHNQEDGTKLIIPPQYLPSHLQCNPKSVSPQNLTTSPCPNKPPNKGQPPNDEANLTTSTDSPNNIILSFSYGHVRLYLCLHHMHLLNFDKS